MSHSDKGEGTIQTGHFRRRYHMQHPTKNVLRQMVKSRLPYRARNDSHFASRLFYHFKLVYQTAHYHMRSNMFLKYYTHTKKKKKRERMNSTKC